MDKLCCWWSGTVIIVHRYHSGATPPATLRSARSPYIFRTYGITRLLPAISAFCIIVGTIIRSFVLSPQHRGQSVCSDDRHVLFGSVKTMDRLPLFISVNLAGLCSHCLISFSPTRGETTLNTAWAETGPKEPKAPKAPKAPCSSVCRNRIRHPTLPCAQLALLGLFRELDQQSTLTLDLTPDSVSPDLFASCALLIIRSRNKQSQKSIKAGTQGFGP
jgi:hypothetical protein